MKRRLLLSVVALALINFFLFVFGAMYLGGDALNGKAVEGHNFLAEHGHCTEVSRHVFVYSQWHARSVFVTHTLAIVCGVLLSRENRKAR